MVAHQRDQRGAQLVAGARGDPAAVLEGIEVPGGGDGGHPDLAGGAVAVDDDAGAVAQFELEDARAAGGVALVGVELAEALLEVGQLGVGAGVEAGGVHVRGVAVFGYTRGDGGCARIGR